MTALRKLLLPRLYDLWAGCTHLPTPAAWRRCLVYYVIFAGCGVPIGFASGLLRFEPMRMAPAVLFLLMARLFVAPALVEELFFRGLPLPQDSNGVSRQRLLTLCAASLSLFVASHVVNGFLFHRVDVFTNPWFLLEAAMLGAICTAAYLTSGSVWPGVLAHWLTVVVWIVLLGGHKLVQLHLSAAR